MFSRGGYKLPAYGSGGFKPKVKWKLDDVVEEYGIKGLEWLQRKYMEVRGFLNHGVKNF